MCGFVCFHFLLLLVMLYPLYHFSVLNFLVGMMVQSQHHNHTPVPCPCLTAIGTPCCQPVAPYNWLEAEAVSSGICSPQWLWSGLVKGCAATEPKAQRRWFQSCKLAPRKQVGVAILQTVTSCSKILCTVHENNPCLYLFRLCLACLSFGGHSGEEPLVV